mgnify:FL=1
MKREFFNQQFAALVSAYTISAKLSDEAQDVYWSMLQLIPEERFGEAVKKCLASCKFFPTISELGEASYPTIEEPSPYNAFVYHEPRKINWQEQVQRQIERKAIESGKVAIDGAREWEPPEVRAVRK